MSEVMGCAPAGSSVLPMEQCRPLLIPQEKSLKERLLPLALAVRAPGGMTSDTTARVSVFSATSALSLHTLVAMAQRLGSETFMRFICCRTLDPLVSAVFMLMVEDGWPRGMDLMTALRSEPMPRISVTTTGSQLVCCEGRLPMCGPLRSSTTVAQVATSSDRSVQLAHWMAACMFFSGLSMPASARDVRHVSVERELCGSGTHQPCAAGGRRCLGGEGGTSPCLWCWASR